MRMIPVGPLPLVLTLIVASSVTPSFAQNLGWSHGTQSLRSGTDECLTRAETALSAEGYRLDDRSEGWRGGTKAGLRAQISCNPAPGNATWANVVVVSNSGFNNLPDNEKNQLQERMDPRQTQQGFNNRPVSATSAILTGRWTWVATCRDSTPSGRLEIANQRQSGDFSGSFSNTNNADTGTIDGKQQGLLVEFRR